MWRSKRDPIGFDPTINQDEFGTPQNTPYGAAVRATAPQAGIDYFPTFPYRGSYQFGGMQGNAGLNRPALYGKLSQYQGIAPITLQPLINKPYPYQKRKK